MNVLVLGAGQLARMMALATMPLGIKVKAYDVGTKTVVNPLDITSTYGNLSEGIEACDWITAEFEHIAHDVLAQCEASGKLKPSANAIKIGGDRRLEKQLLESCNVANAKHKIIETKTDFDAALNALSLPIIFKSALEGYDGKGQWRLKDIKDAESIWHDMHAFMNNAKNSQAIVAEQMVPFVREISLVGVRNPKGEIKTYPLTENHHTNGVLTISLALESDQALQVQAEQAFSKIANKLDYAGVLAIEFFQVGDELLVNELAPRVHNSGHWTQQGADTCQFENHIRGICNIPLGSTSLIRPTAMVNILGEDSISQETLAISSVTQHWYGKSKRSGRKMGHLNVSGTTKSELFQRLEEIAKLLPESAFPDLKGYIAAKK